MDTRSKLLNKVKVAWSVEENREKFELFLTALSLFVLFMLFFLPVVNNLNGKLLKNRDLKAEKEYISAKLNNFETLSQYYLQLQSIERDIVSKIPINPDPSSTLEKFNNYSRLNNIKFRSLNLVNKGDGIETYDIVLEGNFSNISDFFSDIRGDERFFKVSSVNLDSMDNSLLNLKVVISSYYYEE